jgi:hypothetical protein
MKKNPHSILLVLNVLMKKIIFILQNDSSHNTRIVPSLFLNNFHERIHQIELCLEVGCRQDEDIWDGGSEIVLVFGFIERWTVIDRDTHACGRVGYARAGTRTVGEKRISFFFCRNAPQIAI